MSNITIFFSGQSGEAYLPRVIYKTGFYTVSVLRREEGYTVKYTPLSEGGGVYLTVDPESSPYTDIISF